MVGPDSNKVPYEEHACVYGRARNHTYIIN